MRERDRNLWTDCDLALVVLVRVSRLVRRCGLLLLLVDGRFAPLLLLLPRVKLDPDPRVAGRAEPARRPPHTLDLVEREEGDGSDFILDEEDINQGGRRIAPKVIGLWKGERMKPYY